MKKIFKSLIAMMLLICMVLAISSCGIVSVPRDLEEAAENLEDEDYRAYYSDDEDELTPGMTERLYAYGEDDEMIGVFVFKTAKAANLYYKQLKMSRDHEIERMKNEIEELEHQIKLIEYSLKKFDDDLDNDQIDDYEEEIEELEDEIKELKKELKEMKKDYVIGHFGKRVWFGSKDAFKDAK